MTGFVVGSAIYELTLDRTRYTADLDRVQRETDTKTRAMSGMFGKLGGALGEVGKIAAGEAIGKLTGIAVGKLTGIIGAASDLNESLSKNQVLFGQYSGQLSRFAGESASSFGIAKNAALEATGVFGNLFRAMQIGQQPAAAMSTKLVGLAGDLASFNNADPGEVLEALRSGLVGETEPLRKFGVNLNQAAIQSKAMSLGLFNGTGQISAAAQAQAAYALILEQTTLAQGDFARTCSGLANSTRVVKAEFADMGATLGSKVLPLMAPVVAIFAQKLPGALDTSGRLLGAFGRRIAPFGRDLLTLGRYVIGVVRDGDALNGWLTRLPAAMQPLARLFGQAIPYVITLARDSLTTFRQALAGDWVDASGIRPLHRLIGELGLTIRDDLIPAVRDGVMAVRDFFTPEHIANLRELGRLAGAFVQAFASSALRDAARDGKALFIDVLKPAVDIVGNLLSPLLQLNGAVGEHGSQAQAAGQWAATLLEVWLGWKTATTVIGTIQDITGQVKALAGQAQSAYNKVSSLASKLQSLGSKTVTITQQFAQTGSNVLGSAGSTLKSTLALAVEAPTWFQLYWEDYQKRFGAFTSSLTQTVSRAGAQLITDFADKVQRIRQVVTIEQSSQAADAARTSGKGLGEALGRGLGAGFAGALGGAIASAMLGAELLAGVAAAIVGFVSLPVIVGALIVLAVAGAAVVAYHFRHELVSFFTESLPKTLAGIDWSGVLSTAVEGAFFTLGLLIAAAVVIPILAVTKGSILIVSALSDGLSALAGVVASAFGGAWDWIANSVPTWPGAIGGFLVDLPSTLAGAFGDAKDAATTALGGILDWASQTLPTYPGKIAGFLVDLPSTLAGAFGDAKDAATTALGGILDWASQTLPTYPGKIAGFLAGLPGALSATARDAVRGFLSPFASLAGSLVGPLNWVIEHALNPFLDGVSTMLKQVGVDGLPHIGTISDPGSAPLPAGVTGGEVGLRAMGGVIAAPELSWIGEDGPTHPEIVIPTNPRYRQRAVGLLLRAHELLGPGPLPHGGGFLDRVALSLGGGLGWVERQAGDLVGLVSDALAPDFSALPPLVSSLGRGVFQTVKAAVTGVLGHALSIFKSAAKAAAGALGGSPSEVGFIKPIPGGVFVQGSYVGTHRVESAIDWAAPRGTPVYAPMAGTVDWIVPGATYIGVDGASGRGLELQHPGGWTTRYGHLSAIVAALGEALAQGQLLGYSGSPELDGGAGSGAHLHFALLRNGAYVDAAENYVPLARGGTITGPTLLGEEAPTHPEYVIATNPAYRRRNLDLWRRAGRRLGVLGLAEGGVIPIGAGESVTIVGDPADLDPSRRLLPGGPGTEPVPVLLVGPDGKPITNGTAPIVNGPYDSYGYDPNAVNRPLPFTLPPPPAGPTALPPGATRNPDGTTSFGAEKTQVNSIDWTNPPPGAHLNADGSLSFFLPNSGVPAGTEGLGGQGPYTINPYGGITDSIGTIIDLAKYVSGGAAAFANQAALSPDAQALLETALARGDTATQTGQQLYRAATHVIPAPGFAGGGFGGGMGLGTVQPTSAEAIMDLYRQWLAFAGLGASGSANVLGGPDAFIGYLEQFGPLSPQVESLIRSVVPKPARMPQRPLTGGVPASPPAPGTPSSGMPAPWALHLGEPFHPGLSGSASAGTQAPINLTVNVGDALLVQHVFQAPIPGGTYEVP